MDTLVFGFNEENIDDNVQGLIYAVYELKLFTSGIDNKLYVNADYKPTTRPVIV